MAPHAEDPKPRPAALNNIADAERRGSAQWSPGNLRSPASPLVVDYGRNSISRHFDINDAGWVSRQRAADHPSQKPNILYIMADQMAAPELKVHNPESVIKTPNIDKLAKEGIVFDNAYSNSPLCAPSRFTMVSGQLPSKIAAYDNAATLASDVPTYAHYLRREGYETALAGKMHFIGADQLHGYEHRLTSDIYPGDFGWSVNWDAPKMRQEWYHNMSSVLQAGPCVRSNQLDFDEEVVYKSSQFLHDYARGPDDKRPFCLTVAMTHPHDPYTISHDFWDMYEDVEIPLPKVQMSQDKQCPHNVRIAKAVDLWDRDLPEESVKRARRAYYGSCSYVDSNIGKLMKILKQTRLDKNTIIIFSGDHGDMLGERSMWYKMSWYENSARVPMIWHFPPLFQPGRVKENISTVDMLPTLCDVVGTKPDKYLPMDGKSFYPALVGTGKPMDEVFGEYMGEGTCTPIMMIRRGKWKYVTCLSDPPQLFDLENDPLELNNLAESKKIDIMNIATNFAKEAAGKWNFRKIHEQVLQSQRQRRLCWSALRLGRYQPWDWSPPYEADKKYIRATMDLDDLERRARYPPVDHLGRENFMASIHGVAGAAGQ